MKVTIEKYLNIIKMLNSTDKENQVVALTIIDQIDIKDNITKVLLLKKHSKSSIDAWEEHAPNAFAYLQELDKKKVIDMRRHLTYKNVLKAITVEKVPQEELDFYMADFGDYLKTQLQGMGYDDIDTLSITVKYKPND